MSSSDSVYADGGMTKQNMNLKLSEITSMKQKARIIKSERLA